MRVLSERLFPSTVKEENAREDGAHIEQSYFCRFIGL